VTVHWKILDPLPPPCDIWWYFAIPCLPTPCHTWHFWFCKKHTFSYLVMNFCKICVTLQSGWLLLAPCFILWHCREPPYSVTYGLNGPSNKNAIESPLFKWGQRLSRHYDVHVANMIWNIILCLLTNMYKQSKIYFSKVKQL